ncbi:hypothetical protein M408DRAFT_198779 [Serendipita vermifera MAFF 305830]|uniref:Uncharacterized protein n=1 Tax=Serendipita vermifera MAFF 305830 TaxID=933852 RepID=A0A0C3B3D9_SERVB|nr:hypothetical protein M408DRAFT_198779 [Serendipita vermifera MAFF 305830]
MLSKWPHMQHLSMNLTYREKFDWRKELSAAFLREEDPLCPNLITLKLWTNWQEADSYRWELVVEQLFQIHNRGSLSEVSWAGTREEYHPGSKSMVIRPTVIRRRDIVAHTHLPGGMV